jgi:hypothetical protein
LKKSPHPAVIITTANAILQKLPPQAAIAEQVISARPGNQLNRNDLVHGWNATVLSVSRLCVTLANMLCAVAFLIFLHQVQRSLCGSILWRHARNNPRVRSGIAAHHRRAQGIRASAYERNFALAGYD